MLISYTSLFETNLEISLYLKRDKNHVKTNKMHIFIKWTVKQNQ
ncbi:hypothetical protein CLU82_1489 [Flavobacterium sp. 5]|nr:hypothetical protein CLU82_1489 [Flavobacterium sp. 5]